VIDPTIEDNKRPDCTTLLP